jgi:hypothetical protein
MAAFYGATPGIGALGPKLLSENEALQSAGVYFHRATGSSTWEARQYFMGLPPDLPAANVARSVPSVGGACLMIDTALFGEVGGLAGIYMQGEYEVADFCVRLLDAGYENWYLPDIGLYDLEEQSHPPEVQQVTYQYDRWLFTTTWGEQVGSMMDHFTSEFGHGIRAIHVERTGR